MSIKTIVCLICGKKFWAITGTHLRKHGISVSQYKAKFQNVLLVDCNHKGYRFTEGGTSWNRGLKMGPCSEEHKKNIGKAKSGKPSWKKGKHFIEKEIEFNYQLIDSKELMLVCGCGCGGGINPKDYSLFCRTAGIPKFIHGHNNKNKPQSKEHSTNISIALKSRWKNLDPHLKEEEIKRSFEASQIRPNKLEIFVDGLVQIARPVEFIYSGDGKIYIAGKVPDWFNTNGRKQVIELFGNYWHSEKRTGRTKEQEEKQRIDHFKKYGYDCLIIWESELKNIDLVVERIRNF